MTETSAEERAYAAGLIDGEGCIRVARSKAKDRQTAYFMQVSVTSTTPKLVTWLYDRWGGNFRIYNRAIGLNKRKVWLWAVTSTMAERLLQEILPYLVLKDEQARVALEYQSIFCVANNVNLPRVGKTGRKHAPEVLELKDSYYQRLRDLKTEGTVQHENVLPS